MKNRNLVLATLFALIAVGMAVQSYATTRNWYNVPVNQNGVTDTYALPCTPKYVAGAAGAVTPLLAIDEAGMVYWVAITPITAGDYVTFRDSDTANTSSTAFLIVEAPTVTETTMFPFNPPMAVSNGLSVDISSQTSTFTVCVREADGDL